MTSLRKFLATPLLIIASLIAIPAALLIGLGCVVAGARVDDELPPYRP
jgi:hypothetical protein